jgi:hypothetical protein
MSEQYIHLVGVETVQSAASSMSDSMHDFKQSVNYLAEIIGTFQESVNKLEELQAKEQGE